jgi:hypothetical protein
VNWLAVPPNVFDAAEHTVAWSIDMAEATAAATVRIDTLGQASSRGILVRVSSGAVSGTGILDARGRAKVSLMDDGQGALAESSAWNHDWSATAVAVGADVPDSAAAAETRQRIRAFARRRLASPGDDAFLAEILAAESDY